MFDRKGFTVIELVIVLAVTAVLMTMIVTMSVTISNYTNKAKGQKERENELTTVENFVKDWWNNFDSAEYEYTVDDTTSTITFTEIATTTDYTMVFDSENITATDFGGAKTQKLNHIDRIEIEADITQPIVKITMYYEEENRSFLLLKRS